jgi:hypothetical protein
MWSKASRGALALALTGAAVWLYLVRGDDRPATAGTFPGFSAPTVVRIDMDRLKVERPRLPLGLRDIFAVVTPSPLPVVMSSREREVRPSPSSSVAPPPILSTTPFNLTFMGVVRVTGGSPVAVLLTAQKEILHGRVGDTLAGRYKIVEIQWESVVVQEILLGHTQTLHVGKR